MNCPLFCTKFTAQVYFVQNTRSAGRPREWACHLAKAPAQQWSSAAPLGSSRWGIKRTAPHCPAVRRCSSRRPDAPRARPRRAGRRGASPGPTRPRTGRWRHGPCAAQAPPRKPTTSLIGSLKTPLFLEPRHPKMIEVDIKGRFGKTLTAHSKTTLAFDMEQQRMFKC